MRKAKLCMTKGRVVKDTHTVDIWKGASKRKRGQMVGEVEGEPGNVCHLSLRGGFQEDT